MRSSAKIGALLLLAASCVVPAVAQELIVKFDRIRNTVSVEATRADVYEVVQQLFSQAGSPQIDVARNVRGRVTTNLKGVSRDSALASVLSQVGASYRVLNGIYYVRSNRQAPGQADDRDKDRWPPQGHIPGGGKPEEVPANFDKHVDMVARDSRIGPVISALGRMGGVTLRMDRDIPGDLTLDVMAKDEILWTVLKRIAAASHLKLDLTGPREATFRPLPSFAAYYRGRRIGGSNDYFSCRNCRFEELKRGWKFCPMCGDRLDR
jgi:hypothetical protein